ncbi:MAG TPA: hypothetical protein VF484_02965 [Candidatus Limnocylindrales bacterium]
MTLPFRRRHHDAEAGHDRARSLWSIEMNEPLDPRDASWLAAHLEGCTECRLEWDAQVEDRSLLRSLRDRPIEPPRDLWARTAAAIEREAGRSSRGGLPLTFPSLVPARARVPLGVLSGVLVVIVVVAVSFAPNTSGPTTGDTGASHAAASNPPVAVATPLEVAAAPVTYVTTGPDGSIRIVHANVDEVCPDEKSGCAPLQQETGSSMTLGAPAQALVVSPNSSQLVVVQGPDQSHAGSVIVVPVPTASASGAPGTQPPATQAATTAPATVAPSGPPASGGTASPIPTPVATPEGAHPIAVNVVVVGEARYSPDGHWLAFSAKPVDGSTGPDLYIWNGTDPAAMQVTTDHATYFSSWFGDQVLASRLDTATAGPAASPGASATASSAPVTATPATPATPATSPQASPAGASGNPGGPIVVELHPSSFLVDPATGKSQPLAKPDIWLPTVDRSGRFVTYWSGTVIGGPGANGIHLLAGHLVLDGWLDPIDTGAPAASGQPSDSPTTSPTDAPPTSPEASTTPATVGPAGTPIELAPGPIAAGPITAFEARFDPTGTRLAVWVADPADPQGSVGTLTLIVLDRGHGKVDGGPSPLQSVRALKGVSIDDGRLAWVSPPGQDGNQSTVQVLAWSADGQFGQVETVPGEQLTIVH